MWLHKISYMFLNCWNVLRRVVLLKVSGWPHFTQNLRCWYSIPVPAAGQATITIFLNVPSSVSHQDPPHLFVWKYGESTKFLTHFLLANQISGVLYLSFHSKDVLFFFTQHCCCFFLSGSYVVVGQNVWGQLVQQDSKWKVEGERCGQIQSFTFSGF